MDMKPSVKRVLRATSEQLRAERAALGMTIDRVAASAGMSRMTVMRLESGERSASVVQLAALCGVYGLTLTEFMERMQQRVDRAREARGDDNSASGAL